MVIDSDFLKRYKKTGVHAGHSVRGKVIAPAKLGIHGTQVAVDQDLCNGDFICVSVYPVTVFDTIKSQGHPNPEEKSDTVNEPACFFCRAARGWNIITLVIMPKLQNMRKGNRRRGSAWRGLNS